MDPILGIFGFATATLIALIAFRRGSLSGSGAVGTVLVGSLTMAFGGWPWGILIVVFFTSSTLLSHFRQAAKASAARRYDKSHRRDLGQVLANGGLATALAVLHGLFPASHWLPAFIGVVAAVTADTWATELGGLSRHRPRLITSGKRVPAGTSGGVSAAGLLASLGGGLLIGAAAALWAPAQWRQLLLLAGLCGVIGSLIDSLLGATVQRIYFDASLPGQTERASVGGRLLPLVRGWRWMSNDMVNLLASAGGGLSAFGLSLFS